MVPPEISAHTLKGMQFLGALKKDGFFQSHIVRDLGRGGKIHVEDEYGHSVECDSFVSFSPEAIDLFPGSYISPLSFQRALEGTPKSLKMDEMVGSGMGTVEQPIYEYKSLTGEFGVTILHGATNDRAIQLARIAKESDSTGFSAENRVMYQQAVADMIQPALERAHDLTGSLRIHDDCLASTVSIVGYLADLKKHNSDLLKEGVDIIIDGPATAQGILFLKRFAEINKIKLSITASFLAFGLTEGEISAENKTRKHANYITLPDELFKILPLTTRSRYEEFSPNDKDRAVVGDMGEASKGILPKEMAALRDRLIIDGGDELCPWNDTRTDSHTPQNSPEAIVQTDIHDSSKKKTNVYFPRGGYICYSYDKTYAHEMFASANTLMVGATRLWSPIDGYGVAYGVKK